MKNKILVAVLIMAVIPPFAARASEEDFLAWTSAVIQCGKTPEAGDVSCEIKVGEKGWDTFTIQAFGETHTLSPTDLAKLSGFPLSSLQTTHEAGYEELGRYSVHFRFDRTFYNPDKKLVNEIIYVSVTRKGVTVSDRQTKGNLAASDHISAVNLLERFKATDFNSFFGTTKATFRQDNLGGALFKDIPGYMTGGTLWTRYRGVGIAIFESHDAAMTAVESRRKSVAAIIKGGPKERGGISNWWFGESQALLSIVQDSIVFEVSILDKHYSEVENELWEAAMNFLIRAEPAAPFDREPLRGHGE